MEGFSHRGGVLLVLNALLSPFSPGNTRNSSQLIWLDLYNNKTDECLEIGSNIRYISDGIISVIEGEIMK